MTPCTACRWPALIVSAVSFASGVFHFTRPTDGQRRCSLLYVVARTSPATATLSMSATFSGLYCTFAIIPALAFPNFVCCARTVPFRNPERESCPVMCDTCIGYPYCASFASSLFFCFSYCCMVDYPQHCWKFTGIWGRRVFP